MKKPHPYWPKDIFDQFTHDAAAAGYTSKRIGAQKSRWTYLKKLLALGRQYAEAISRN